MKAHNLIALCILFNPLTASAVESIYCPQKQGYINVGMTQGEVINACGQPTAKQTNISLTQRVPVTQLIYTTLNQGAVYSGLNVYYNMWSLPSGSNGTSLTIDVINDKVHSISINGASTNAMSICGGENIQKGDNVNNVYSACGSPSLVNNTYIEQNIPKSQHPEVWIYQIDQYNPAINLTFINGNLQSIQ